MSDDILEVTQLWASKFYLYCPSCGAKEEGFISDPLGNLYTCEECGNNYYVSPHADVEIR